MGLFIMTKLRIFDNIELLKNQKKRNTGFSENDKIEHFWQNWKSEKIHGPLTKWQNWALLTKLKNRKIHSPLRKWQNWAFFTKLKKRKYYKGLSENDKIDHFWQNWKSEQSIWGFLKWQYWGVMTILKNRKKHTGFSENVLTKLKKR